MGKKKKKKRLGGSLNSKGVKKKRLEAFNGNLGRKNGTPACQFEKGGEKD